MGKLNANLKRHGASSTTIQPLNAAAEIVISGDLSPPASSTTTAINSITHGDQSVDQGQRNNPQHHHHHHHLQHSHHGSKVNKQLQHHQHHHQKHAKNIINKKSSSPSSSSSSSLFNLLLKEKQFIDHNNTMMVNEVNLIYRAEGNANLVLSLPDSHQVLRLRKSIKNDIDTKG